MNRFYQIYPDCNRCETKCGGIFDLKAMQACSRHIPPKEGWMLAELALAHPSELNEALKDLPFDVSLNFYLK